MVVSVICYLRVLDVCQEWLQEAGKSLEIKPIWQKFKKNNFFSWRVSFYRWWIDDAKYNGEILGLELWMKLVRSYHTMACSLNSTALPTICSVKITKVPVDVAKIAESVTGSIISIIMLLSALFFHYCCYLFSGVLAVISPKKCFRQLLLCLTY